MHEKPQPEGKPLLVTMAAHQPGEGKGKGKDGGVGTAEVGDNGIIISYHLPYPRKNSFFFLNIYGFWDVFPQTQTKTPDIG